MIGFTNLCPHCGARSSFTPEEMECDKSLVLWCNTCGEYVSQTFTLETFRRWWKRYEAGEDDTKPPVSKEMIFVLEAAESKIKEDPNCFLDKIEIHFKDFNDYRYSDTGDENGQQNTN